MGDWPQQLGNVRRERDKLSEFGIITKSGEVMGSANPTSQVIFGGSVYLYAGETVTNISVCVQTAPTGTDPTAIKLGLWSSAATPVCLAVTADLGADTRWDTPGWKVCALTSPYAITTSSLYYAAFWINGAWTTTNVALAVMAGIGQPANPIGSGKRWYCSLKTSATTMAASDTGTYAASGNVPLMALS